MTPEEHENYVLMRAFAFLLVVVVCIGGAYYFIKKDIDRRYDGPTILDLPKEPRIDDYILLMDILREKLKVQEDLINHKNQIFMKSKNLTHSMIEEQIQNLLEANNIAHEIVNRSVDRRFELGRGLLTIYGSKAVHSLKYSDKRYFFLEDMKKLVQQLKQYDSDKAEILEKFIAEEQAPLRQINSHKRANAWENE